MSDLTRISWTCRKCGFSIADGAGSVNIPFARLSAHRPGVELVWRVEHDACLDTPDVYGVAVEYLRDARGVLQWTHHLMSKNWFADSTWDGIIATALVEERAGA